MVRGLEKAREHKLSKIKEGIFTESEASGDGSAYVVTYSSKSGASPKGAITSWVQVPPGQWSVGPVA